MIFLETDDTEDIEVDYFIAVEFTSASWARLAHPMGGGIFSSGGSSAAVLMCAG